MICEDNLACPFYLCIFPPTEGYPVHQYIGLLFNYIPPIAKQAQCIAQAIKHACYYICKV